MKKQFIFAILALAFASFACSIQNIQMNTINTQQVDIMEPLPGNAEETVINIPNDGRKVYHYAGCGGVGHRHDSL